MVSFRVPASAPSAPWPTAPPSAAPLPPAPRSAQRVTAQTCAALERLRALYRDGQFDDAIEAAVELLGQCAELDPTPPDVAAVQASCHTLLGLCLMLRDQPEQAQVEFATAVKAFDLAREEVSGHGGWTGEYGIALQAIGRADLAEARLREALDLGEDTPDVRRNLGASLLAQGRHAAAVDVLDQAVRRAPRDWQAAQVRAQAVEAVEPGSRRVASAWADAARVLAASGLPGHVVAALRRARTADPDDVGLLAELANALLADGRAEEALAELSSRPDDGSSAALAAPTARAHAALQEHEAALRHADAALQVDPSDTDAMSVRAWSLMALGHHEAALVAAEQVLGLRPDEPHATTVRGLQLLTIGRYAEAVPALTQAVRLTGRAPSLLVQLASALRLSGDPSAALDALDEVVQRDPALVEAFTARADLRFERGDPEGAQADLEEAVGLAPDSPYVLGRLGTLLYARGDVSASLDAFDRALASDPDLAWVWTARGTALVDLERLTEAEAAFRAALERDPDDATALVGLADLLLSSLEGSEQEVEDLVARARAADPQAPVPYAILGELRRRQGRLVEALEALDEALRRAPDYAYALGTKGQVLHALDRFDDGITSLRRAAALEPDQAWIVKQLGSQLLAAEHRDEAAVVLTEAARLQPDDAQVHHLLGLMALEAADPTAAVRELRRTTELDPDNADAWKQLGDALSRAGEPQEALEAVSRALEAAAGDAVARALRGQVLYDLGRFVEALDEFERALSLDGEHGGHGGVDQDVDWAWAVLGDLYRLLGRYDDAMVALDTALARRADDAVALAARGATLRVRGDLAGAERDLRSALELDPDSLFAVRNLRLALLADGSPDEALEVVRTGARRHAREHDWQRELAEALFLGGNQRAALDVLDNVLWESPDDAATLRALGWVLLGMRRHDEALASFERAVAIDDADVVALADLAAAQAQAGRHTEALRTIEQAVLRAPEDGWVRARQSELLAQVGEWDLAVDAARTAVVREPADVDALLALCWGLQHLAGQEREALDAAERAVHLDATAAWARKARADVLWALGRVEEARTDYRWVIDMRDATGEADAGSWMLAGWCSYRLGQYQQAAAAYQRALPLASSRADLFFDLALLTLESGQRERSRDTFRRALAALEEMDPLRQRGTVSVALHDLEEAVQHRPDLLEHAAAQVALQQLRAWAPPLPTTPI